MTEPLASDEFHERLERSIAEHLPVLNRLEPHLGCAKCHGPLDDNDRCPVCQP